MSKKQAEDLWTKYQNGTCSTEEEALLESWLTSYTAQNNTAPDLQEMLDTDALLRKSLKELKHNPNKFIKLNWRLCIATAAAVSLIAIAAWLYNPEQYNLASKSQITDIAPGGNKATLLLSNGQSIPLSENHQGIIVGSEKISYNDGTKIPVADLTAIQTINTPKGGQYQIELPEGTKVWLNSSTVVQYAANLNIESGERKFRLIAGEAYFEISKDKEHPFIVSTLGQKVQVLGTHFNINAYSP
ncbi:MAG: FecR family protein, partial [Bacteroidota bacterium]